MQGDHRSSGSSPRLARDLNPWDVSQCFDPLLSLGMTGTEAITDGMVIEKFEGFGETGDTGKIRCPRFKTTRARFGNFGQGTVDAIAANPQRLRFLNGSHPTGTDAGRTSQMLVPGHGVGLQSRTTGNRKGNQTSSLCAIDDEGDAMLVAPRPDLFHRL